MAIEIVNTAPGTSPDLIKPGQPIHLSLKSLDGTITLGALKASLGMTDIRFHGVLPEDDPALVDGRVVFAVPEHLEPPGGMSSISSAGGVLTITRTSSSQLDYGVYEISYPIQHDASVLAYFRFRRQAWGTQQPDFCYVPGIVAPYLGVRAGPANSGAFVFLQDLGGTGDLVVGGPLQALRQARPVQQTLPFNWKTVPIGSPIEIWIFVNQAGLPPPYPTPYVPVVEVWKRVAGDAGPVLLTTLPIQISALGAFPRGVFEDRATIYLGNGGLVGDAVSFEDWAFFPDYRLGVLEGTSLPYHAMSVLPDGPLMFRADDGRRPDADYAGRWFRSTDPGSFSPNVSFGFQPGRKLTPQTVNLTKSLTTPAGDIIPADGHSVFERYEPRIGMQSEGFMIEAFMAGQPDVQERDAFGAGFEVDDGATRYQVVMMKNALRQTYALAGPGAQSELSSHFLPEQDVDFTSLKLIRLVADRVRDELRLEVDDEVVLSKQLSMAQLPATAANGRSRIRFGHVFDLHTQGTFSLALLNYFQRFLAYEVSDGSLPEAATLYFTKDFSSDASSTLVSSTDGKIVSIKKVGFDSLGTKAKYTRTYDFGENKGSYLEFKARVADYADVHGTPFASRTEVGAGVEVRLGNKVLHFGFFECGLHGKRIGILPGSGSADDIIEQTDLGRRFSAAYDWSESHTYRIIFLPYKRVEVWVESVAGEPAIVLPWSSAGFDLPAESSLPSFSFGHLTENEASTSEWSFIRWGSSNGYEVAVTQQYPHGFQSYQLDGKFLMNVGVDDYADGSDVITNVNYTRFYTLDLFDLGRIGDQAIAVFELPGDGTVIATGTDSADAFIEKAVNIFDAAVATDYIDVTGTVAGVQYVMDIGYAVDLASTVGDTYVQLYDLISSSDFAPSAVEFTPYSVQDTSTASDSTLAAKDAVNNIFDVATTSDSVDVDAIYDIITSSDSADGTLDALNNVLDSALVSDAVYIAGYNIVSDAAVGVDSVSSVMNCVHNVFDTVVSSDSVVYQSNVYKIFDTATATDSVNAFTNHADIFDTAQAADSPVTVKGNVSSVSDVAVGTDSTATTKDVSSNVNDTATGVDTVDVVQTP